MVKLHNGGWVALTAIFTWSILLNFTYALTEGLTVPPLIFIIVRIFLPVFATALPLAAFCFARW